MSRACPDEAKLTRYVDRDLSPEDSRALTEHVQSCARCHEQVAELRGMIDALQPIAPSREELAQHVSDIMARLDATAAAAVSGKRGRAPWRALAAAACVCLAIGVYEIRPHATWQARGGLLAGSLSLALGGYYALYGGSALALHDGLRPYLSSHAANLMGAVFLGLSGVSLGYGTYSLLSRWNGERLAVEYARALGHGDYAAAFALANDRLRELGAAERRNRWVGGVLAGLFTVGSAGALIGEEVVAKSAHERLNGRILAGLGMLVGLSIRAARCS
jgi:hypothetical protein